MSDADGGRPPRLARAALAVLLPRDARDHVLADLDEMWAERVSTEDRTSANRWYRSQVGRAVLPAIRRRAARFTEKRRVSPRGVGRGDIMGSVKQDLAFAFKQLKRNPAMAVTVVATLALGIGATTAIFSAVHGVLLRPLPYEDPHELVMITSEMGGSSEVRYVSGPDAMDLVSEVASVDELALFGETTVGPLTEVDRPQHIKTTWASWNAFDLLGIDASLGRTFVADDGIPIPQSDSVRPPWAAVISHDFWERSLGADPDVLGRVVHIWGGAAEIVGVLPPDLRLLTPPELNLGGDVDIWNVFRSDFQESSREGRWYRAIGRLAGGASVRQAQQEVDAFVSRLRERHPHHAQEDTHLRVASVEAAVAGPVRGPLVLLMGAVSMVLLIACFNVANLLLAHGTTRAGEMAVRSSLGAERSRLVRQLLTESAVLAALGALAGIALAAVGVNALQAIRPADLHRFQDVRLDLPVLSFTLVVAVAATLLAGLLPALHVARSSLGDWLRVRGGTGVAQRSRRVLVIAEVALSVVLLAGAGLLIRTLSELQRLPLGFEPHGVLTVTATQTGRPRGERQAYEADLMNAVTSVPGVQAAGIVFPLPMNGVYDRSAEYAMEGEHTDPAGWTEVYFRTVSPSYFDAMGIELLLGRGFTSADEDYEVPVVILDRRLAEREWGARDPVGDHFWVRGMEGDTLQARVVGVVEHVPQWDHRDTQPTMYFPRVFYQSHEVSVVAVSLKNPSRMGPALMSAIRRVDPGFPSDMMPMTGFVSERLAASRFFLTLMEVFAGVALLLSAVGLYGVLSYAVRQRTRELGIRLAFGAVASSLTADVVWSGARLALTGITVGLLGAVVMGQGLEAQLFRVEATDPWALAATVGAVLLVSLLASLIPAVRASRVDPMVALRED